MKLKVKKIFLTAAIIVFLAVVDYVFVFGPLFPYCPIKLGFDALALPRCVIYYPQGMTLDPDYKKLPVLMEETEQFHQLHFRKRLQIVVCASNAQHRRFSMSNGHACTVQTGATIYIRPSIQEATYPPRLQKNGGEVKMLTPEVEGHRDLVSFLKHEISHALLYQNTSLCKAFRIKNWVEEGVAVYYGNPDHYYRGEMLRTLAIDTKAFFNVFDDTAEPVNVPVEIKNYFRYGMFSELIRNLVGKYGQDNVLAFIREYIRSPGEEAQLFEKYFKIAQEKALEEFQQHIGEISVVNRI